MKRMAFGLLASIPLLTITTWIILMLIQIQTGSDDELFDFLHYYVVLAPLYLIAFGYLVRRPVKQWFRTTYTYTLVAMLNVLQVVQFALRYLHRMADRASLLIDQRLQNFK